MLNRSGFQGVLEWWFRLWSSDVIRELVPDHRTSIWEGSLSTTTSTEAVLLVEFMYLVSTRMPGESYRRRLRSLLYLRYVFRALINSLVSWFCTSALGLVLFQIFVQSCFVVVVFCGRYLTQRTIMILNCWTKLTVEKVVCFVCAYWSANRNLSLTFRRHVDIAHIAGIAQWLERQTRGWKVASSNPRWSGGIINFLVQGQLSVLTLILVSVPPPCYRSST